MDKIFAIFLIFGKNSYTAGAKTFMNDKYAASVFVDFCHVLWQGWAIVFVKGRCVCRLSLQSPN